MAAEGSFFFRAEAKNRIARFLVEGVGLELDTDASPDLEGVAQHEIFRLGVDCGALPGWCDPGRTDFHTAIRAVDVHETRAADDASGGALDSGENHGFAALLLVESFIDEPVKIFQSSDRVGNPAKNVFQVVAGDVPEEIGVFAADRLEADDGALKGERQSNVQGRCRG